MSVEYLKSILENGRNIVCLMGRTPAALQGCDFYRDEYGDEVELKYGYSADDIFPAPSTAIAPGLFTNSTGRKY